MVRNTDGLKRSARSRSEDAVQRATAAILLMQSEEAEINFRSVAARAKVSTAWLYGTKSVRDKIVKIRNTSPVVRRRECATSAAALARTSRGDSQNPHSNSGGNQSRAERAARSRIRQACGGTAEAGVTAPNIRIVC